MNTSPIETANRVKDWMSATVITIRREQTVGEALELLRINRISALIVTDKEDRSIGIVTIGDFIRSAWEAEQTLKTSYPYHDDCLWAIDLIQRRLGSDKIYTVMTELVEAIGPEETMQQAANLMYEQNLHHLVVNGQSRKEIEGILSASDFVRFVRQNGCQLNS